MDDIVNTPQKGGASPAWDLPFSVAVWFIVIALTIGFCCAIILCSAGLWWADRKHTVAHRLASCWGRAIFACIPSWRLTVTGRHHIPRHRAVILVANHQSLLDIMAIFCLNRQFKWIAKDSLFRVPILGWAMAMCGYIRLVRGRHGSIRETYHQAQDWLAQDVSVFLFPEGTRSTTGEMLPFKNGPFKLAVETGVPVIPITIRGTSELIQRGSWRFRPRAHVTVTVLPALSPAAKTDREFLRLKDATRRAIEQNVLL